MIENRKGYSCWSKADPGCGFVIWKKKAGKMFTPAIAKELIEMGRTEKPVTGFKGRSGRQFRAKLKMERDPETEKWRVEFDEDWAREPREPAPEGDGSGGAANGTAPAAENGADGGALTAAAAKKAVANGGNGTAKSKPARGRRRTTQKN